MTVFTPDAERPIEWLFIDADQAPDDLAPWLRAALPRCAWCSHVVLAGGDPDGRLLETVVSFLESETVALVHLHLVADGGLDGLKEVHGLLDAAARFQREAYLERTGSRLVPLPVLEVPAGTDPGLALHTAGELRARLAKPSLLLWNEPERSVVDRSAALGLRIYVGSPDAGNGALGVLADAHVLDGAMARLDDHGELRGSCRSHTVVSAGHRFGCARQWRLNLSGCGDLSEPPADWDPDESLCSSCAADVVAAAGPCLVANRRCSEGRELALQLGAALATERPGAAAAVVGTAVDLASTDEERADALIHRALCLLGAGRLPEADRELVDASRHGAAPGLVNLHRARVQVAWRDDIEALDRYGEALELGTDAASVEDLHFEMALSHIRLEEWSQARGHLELAGGPSAAVSFNLGVCDVNSGRAECALEHFDRALELGPHDDDLGRVLFFRGFCLKELERWDEAADDLERSITLEEPEPAHHNLLGFALYKLGRHAEAVAAFEAAVALDPASAVDWANIGVNLERLGENARAGEMYRKALGMDPSIGFAREGLERVEDGTRHG